MPALAIDFTIPANTQQDTPYEQIINLMAGRVTSISVGFQDGCNKMVHMALFDNLKQILPFLEGQSLAWNDYVFTFTYHMDIPSFGKELLFRGWSPGTLYDHTLTVWFDIDTDLSPDVQSAIDIKSQTMPIQVSNT